MEETNHIITKILHGQRSFERRLYDLYKSKWYMLALRYGHSRDQANDIMQEGLIEIFKDLHQFDSEKSKFTTWSSRVMVHAALRYLKKNNWYNSLLEIEKNERSDEDNVNIYDHLAAEELTLMIQNLPIGYRIVFNMAVIEGYKHQEIAQHLGITVGTSKSQLSKAKKMLRKELESQINSYSNG